MLAGGPGNRLRPLTEDTPKGMVNICGKPLLEWIIEWLRSNEVKRIVLGVAYLKEKIIQYFGDGEGFDVGIKYSVHSIEGGTSEGFRLAISRYTNTDVFFAINGDQITDLNLNELASFHLRNKATATIVAANPRCPYGHIRVDDSRNVVGFAEKPPCLHAFCSTGIYVFRKDILSYLPERGDVEKTTFPILAKKRQLKVYPFKGLFITINTHKDLIMAEQGLMKVENK